MQQSIFVVSLEKLEIIKEIPFDYKEQALLGSLVYLGLSFASLLTSPIITKYGASKVITFALGINSLSCFILIKLNLLLPVHHLIVQESAQNFLNP